VEAADSGRQPKRASRGRRLTVIHPSIPLASC